MWLFLEGLLHGRDKLVSNMTEMIVRSWEGCSFELLIWPRLGSSLTLKCQIKIHDR